MDEHQPQLGYVELRQKQMALTEQTPIRVRINLVQHTQCINVTSMTTTRRSHQGKAWPPNTPGAREADDDIQQQTPTRESNTKGLGEQNA